MSFLRKLVALALYATILLPGSDYRISAWMKAVEVTSTALDRTMRRRKSSVENDRLSRFIKLSGVFAGPMRDALYIYAAG